LIGFEDYLTFAVHVPIATKIQGMSASELGTFVATRGHYIEHDIERSLLLALAAACFALAARCSREGTPKLAREPRAHRAFG
jgi:hypothetical protein